MNCKKCGKEKLLCICQNGFCETTDQKESKNKVVFVDFVKGCKKWNADVLKK